MTKHTPGPWHVEDVDGVPHTYGPTPWGEADYYAAIAEGIAFYGTPSHGGFCLSEERLQQMPAYLRDARTRNTGPWFEEDCEAALVVLAFPEEFTAQRDREFAEKTARYFFPAVYAALQQERGAA
jgi:hypothetical protein